MILLTTLRAGLGRRLAHLLRLADGNLTTHEDADGLVVNLVNHCVEEVDGLQLEDEQRVLLLVRGILHGVLQLVEFAEVFFPGLVDDVQHDGFLERLHHLLAFALGGSLQVDGYLVEALAVGDGDEDVLVAVALFLIDALDDGIGDARQRVGLAFEVLHGKSKGLFGQFLRRCFAELLLGEGRLHGKDAEHLFLDALVVVVLNGFHTAVPNHVGDVHAKAFADEGVTTFGIDYRTLFVHHIVVFQQALTDAEVVLLDFLLGILDGLADHAVLQHLALLETHAVHDGSDAVAGEEAHQVVFQRDVEDRRARVTLTSGTATQLTVDASAFVTFRTDNGQATCLTDLGGELDIRTTTSHVGGDGDSTEHTLFKMFVAVLVENLHRAQRTLTRLGNNLSLALVKFGIQDIVGNLAHVKHSAQHLADFDGRGAHQHGTSLDAHLLDFLNDGLVLLALGLVDSVVHIVADNGLIRGDDDDVKFVDIPEFAGLRFSRTSHTSQLMVHTEVVLQGDGGKGLRSSLDLHTFLGLDGLVKTVGIAASLHDTARLLIDNLHVAFLVNDVFHILLKHGVGLQQLIDGVDALALDGVVGEQLVLLLQAFFVGQVLSLQL